jgi:acid phosphatase (class A)
MKFLKHTVIALALALSACVHVEVNESDSAPPAPQALTFDGLGVLGGPPAAGSPGQAADIAITQGPWSPERLAIAAADDSLDPFLAFDEVMGPDFNATNHPATKALLDHVMAVASPAIGATKARWQRARPFVANPAQPTCITPSAALRASGSYPSGHATLGWAWALLLAEIAPSKADALLHRGFEYGQSRVVCGVHWQSDVSDARALGAATVARMHADPGTRALIEAARAEMQAQGK